MSGGLDLAETAGGGTRIRILAALKASGTPMSARELSMRVGPGVSAIKEQCAWLMRKGLLTAGRRPQTMGRPETAYALTPAAEEGFGSPDPWAEELLEAAVQLFGDGAAEKLLLVMLQRRETRWRQALADRAGRERWQGLARLRNRAGYQCVVRQEDGGLVMTDRHRPLARLLEPYPGLARQEEQMVTRLLGPGTVLAPGPQGRVWRQAPAARPLWEVQAVGRRRDGAAS